MKSLLYLIECEYPVVGSIWLHKVLRGEYIVTNVVGDIVEFRLYPEARIDAIPRDVKEFMNGFVYQRMG